MALKDDIAKVLEGFDRRFFVRNTTGDKESNWGIRIFPYLAALGRLQNYVDDETDQGSAGSGEAGHA